MTTAIESTHEVIVPQCAKLTNGCPALECSRRVWCAVGIEHVVVERDVGCQLEILAFEVFAMIDHIRQVGKLLGVVDEIRVVKVARSSAELSVGLVCRITPLLSRMNHTTTPDKAQEEAKNDKINFVFIIYLFLICYFGGKVTKKIWKSLVNKAKLWSIKKKVTFRSRKVTFLFYSIFNFQLSTFQSPIVRRSGSKLMPTFTMGRPESANLDE